MKKDLKLISFVLIILGLILLAKFDLTHGYGIVNNSGTSSEDSLNINVLCLDSLGRPTTCDSFYLVVFKSSANAVVFRDSTANAGAVTWLDTVVIGGRTSYYLRRAVADIDGGGAIGQYAGKVISTTGQNLPTETPFTFQITNVELSDGLDALEPFRNVKKIYVDPDDGNDTNNGLSWTTAKATIDGAKDISTGADFYEFYLSADTFDVEACTVYITQPTKIIGKGREFTILHGISTDHVIEVDIDGPGGFEIEGVKIEGQQGNGTKCGIRILDCQSFYLHDLTLVNNDRQIRIEDQGGFGRIDDVYIFNTYYDGIQCFGHNVLITNVFVDSLRYVEADGIRFSDQTVGADSCKDNIVFNCYVRTTQGTCFSSEIPDVQPDRISWINNFVENDSEALQFEFGGTYDISISNQEASEISADNSNQDDWSAVDVTATAVKTQTDKLHFDADNKVKSNIYKIADDSTAADNLKKMVDNDTTTWGILTLDRVFIEPQGAWPGIYVYQDNNSQAIAVRAVNTSSAEAVEIIADGVGRDALYIESVDNIGISYQGSTYGVYATGGTAGFKSYSLTGYGIDANIHGTIDSTVAVGRDWSAISIQKYLGSESGDTIIFYPPDGSPNKDSCAVFHNGWKKSLTFGHHNATNDDVIDTVFVK